MNKEIIKNEIKELYENLNERYDIKLSEQNDVLEIRDKDGKFILDFNSNYMKQIRNSDLLLNEVNKWDGVLMMRLVEKMQLIKNL